MRCKMHIADKTGPSAEGKPRWQMRWVPLRALSFTTPSGRLPLGHELAISCTFFGVCQMLFLSRHISPIWQGCVIFPQGFNEQPAVLWGSGKGCLTTCVYIYTSGFSLLSWPEPTVLTSHHLPSLDEYGLGERVLNSETGPLSKVLLSDQRQFAQWKLNFRQITVF